MIVGVIVCLGYNKLYFELKLPNGTVAQILDVMDYILPFHEGFLNIFDHSGNAFVSAYREYTNKEHTEVGVHIEYLATPDLTDKVLIIADPMLATGISMEMGMKAFLTKGNPKHIHIACVLAAPEGIEHIKKTFPEDKTTIWCASIDEGLNEHKYIVPGFGDAGDLCYGSKL